MIRHGQGPQQNPPLLVGAGRLARHLSFDFQQLGLPFLTWKRGEDLSSPLARCGRVLLAISDDALPGFIDRELASFEKPITHFSGSFHHARAAAAHPLMSFGPELYEPAFYRRVHYTVTGTDSLRDAVPGLPNPFTRLAPEHKGLYHALCVIGGNFPVLLWNKMETGLKELGLPEEAVRPYVERVAENYMRLGAKALTGPLIRKDETTIASNLKALNDDPWKKVYEAFREATK